MNSPISSSATTESNSSSRKTSGKSGEKKRRSSAPANSLSASVASLSFADIHQREEGCLVTFDKVFVYEFSITLGDNPAVREGCPIALDNKCIQKTVIDIESFEKLQSIRRGKAKRRRVKDLYMPVQVRAALLLSRGFTLEEIVKAVLEVERIKKSRHESMKLNGWQKVNIALDSAGRSLFRKFTSGNTTAANNNKSSETSDDDVKVGGDQKCDTVTRAARTA
jgi:hypothetical protein